MYRYNSDDIIY